MRLKMLNEMRHHRRTLGLTALCCVLVVVTVRWLRAPTPLSPPPGRYLPLIFIGGVPRSGTTLMRVMLDAHHDVRCGQETRVIPTFISFHNTQLSEPFRKAKLEQAGVTKRVFDNAMAAFCLQIIAGHGEPAPRLCTKDPFLLGHASYMHQLFPNAKFLFMVRDGRASAHSTITRHITISGVNLTSYSDCMKSWNRQVKRLYKACAAVGKKYCLAVRYETLVLQPERALRPILRWLGLVWSDNVLHHERYIQQPDGAALSYVEPSTDQVVRPVHVDALDKWVGHIPSDVVANMSELAPMLAKLGYDPRANPPDYRALKEINLHANPL